MLLSINGFLASPRFSELLSIALNVARERRIVVFFVDVDLVLTGSPHLPLLRAMMLVSATSGCHLNLFKTLAALEEVIVRMMLALICVVACN